jgi:uncharacterized cupredoxin-like copper-binding protein
VRDIRRRQSLGCVAAAFTFIGLASAVPAGAERAIGRTTVINVVAGAPSEFKFSFRFPGKPGGVPLGTVVFKVRNAGTLTHTFKVCSSPGAVSANSCNGKSTGSISPGKTASLTVTFKKKGTYEYLCTFPGHAANGMKGPLTAR